MPKEPKHFTVVDPASMDGNPYEVAERAVRQIAGVAGILIFTIKTSRNMLGNAEMERQIHASGEANIEAFDAGPQAKVLEKMLADAENTVKRCAILVKAASFDPKHPPKE